MVLRRNKNAGSTAICISVRNKLAFSRKKVQTVNTQEKFSAECCKEQNTFKKTKFNVPVLIFLLQVAGFM